MNQLWSDLNACVLQCRATVAVLVSALGGFMGRDTTLKSVAACYELCSAAERCTGKEGGACGNANKCCKKCAEECGAVLRASLGQK